MTRNEPLSTPRSGSGLPADLIGAAASFAGIALLLRYLHEGERGWMVGTAVVGGLLTGVVARRAIAGYWSDLPRALARPGIAVVLAVGMLVVALATLVPETMGYCLLVGPRALSLAGIAIALGIGLGLLSLSHRLYARAVEAERVRAAELSAEATRARLRALQAQMNPHFLFNTLNAVAELVHSDPESAEALIEDLSALLRASLHSSSHATIPLVREWDAIERTVRIARARFGDRLDVSLTLDEGARDVPTAGLTVQPLVENAIEHAVATRASGGRIVVTGSVDSGDAVVVVEDDGPGVPDAVVAAIAGGAPSPTGGSGDAGGALANVAQRLRLAHGARGTLAITRGALGGARVEVRWPVGDLDAAASDGDETGTEEDA